MPSSTFVICVNNTGYPAALELRKVYEVVKVDEEDGLIRVIDESGDDYLYSKDWFVEVRLTEEDLDKVRNSH